jgi:D-alanyl-D-alanine dipeptidase
VSDGTEALAQAAAGLGGWKDVPIRECGEPLELLVPSGRIIIHPIYAANGYAEVAGTIRLRSGVIRRLQAAAARLPDGLALLVWDGWPPIALQQRL